MTDLRDRVDALAREVGFAGVVAVNRSGQSQFAGAYGLADRRHEIPNTVDTRFAIASGTKGLTALTVVSLIEQGALGLSTTARSVLGGDLPLIDERVTVEHLLSHRSGIGDYCDEEAEDPGPGGYPLAVPVQALDTTRAYLPALDGFAAKFAPGERFSYCNGGFVVLALIAERVAGRSFYDLVRERVCNPAGMHDTEFLRSDALTPRTATGYVLVDGVWRTNVFHLPVRGSGDGGVYSTVGDVSSLWRALFDGKIVSPDWVARMLTARSEVPTESRRYGLGFWLHASSDVVMLEGYDSGVSFRSAHDPHTRVTHTVISNTSDGAWKIARYLDRELIAR